MAKEHIYIKLVSLNPDKYESIPVDRALEQYYQYLVAFDKNRNLRHSKSFKDWLNTEV